MNVVQGGQDSEGILFQVRIRGKIYGPYPMVQLQELAAKAVVSRINQVSADGGASWQPAADYPEIFNRPTMSEPPGDPKGGPTGPETPAEQAWHYLISGKKHGPTQLHQLQMLVHTGTLSGSDFACKDGAADWSRVDIIPELLSMLPKGDKENAEEEISKRVRNAFGESRPWSMCLGILGLFYSGLTLLVGIWILAAGSQIRSGVAVAMGCTNIVTAIILGTGAFLIIRHSNKVRRFSLESSEKRFVVVAETLVGFWMYASIISICYLILFVTLLILAFVGSFASVLI